MEKPVNDLNIFNLLSRAAGFHLIGQIYWQAEHERVVHETPFIAVFAVLCNTSIAHVDIAMTIDFRYNVQPYYTQYLSS